VAVPARASEVTVRGRTPHREGIDAKKSVNQGSDGVSLKVAGLVRDDWSDRAMPETDEGGRFSSVGGVPQKPIKILMHRTVVSDRSDAKAARWNPIWCLPPVKDGTFKSVKSVLARKRVGPKLGCAGAIGTDFVLDCHRAGVILFLRRIDFSMLLLNRAMNDRAVVLLHLASFQIGEPHECCGCLRGE